MKRRYKPGDWLRVPLGGSRDALGLITAGCRSRLFGYFFSIDAAHKPEHGELRARGARHAIAALLFGGRAIEDGRWPLIATSLAFEPDAWPFPAFAARGAFGDSWMRVTYDRQTLQIAAREAADEQTVSALPDARFAHPHEVESLLRRCLVNTDAPAPQRVCELRSPIDLQRLRPLERGGRVQFSTPLHGGDLRMLAAFLAAHPQVALRVHGFGQGFDASVLREFTQVRDLTLDVREVRHAGELRALRQLRALRIGPARIDASFLDTLGELRVLELRGTRAALEPVLRCGSLETLTLENTAPLDLSALASAASLRRLSLAHGAYDVRAVPALAELRDLTLRALDIDELPPLHGLANLHRVDLEALHGVRDVRPLASAPQLRELHVRGMPHLGVGDFEPLRTLRLARFELDLHSRRKEREVYRLLKTWE